MALEGLGYDASEALNSRLATQRLRVRGGSSETLGEWLQDQKDRPKDVEWLTSLVKDFMRWTAEARVSVPVPRVIIDEPDPDAAKRPALSGIIFKIRKPLGLPETGKLRFLKTLSICERSER